MRERSTADALLELSWPRPRLPEALEALFGRPPASRTVPATDGFALWIDANAHALGMCAEPVVTGSENLNERLGRDRVLLLALDQLDRCFLVRQTANEARSGLVSLFMPGGRWVRRPLDVLDQLDRLDPRAPEAAPRAPVVLSQDLGLDPARAAQLAALLARGHRSSTATSLQGLVARPGRFPLSRPRSGRWEPGGWRPLRWAAAPVTCSCSWRAGAWWALRSWRGVSSPPGYQRGSWCSPP